MRFILLTGHSGFIGSNLAKALLRHGYRMRAAGRRNAQAPYHDFCKVGCIDINTDWSSCLRDIETVIHLAARVHILDDQATDPLSEFRKTNTEATLNLARQAAKSGIRRFIYISTIKVNGQQTPCGIPFTENDPPQPEDHYALSKLEAENGLYEIAAQTGMEVVVIRPPLVYGPGVKANFLRMLELLYSGLPMPFGAINNQRSLLYIENLIDLIMVCIEHPNAANQLFLAADGEDLSTAELLKRLSLFLGKPARLFKIPNWVMETGLKVAGKSDLATRLCGSLQVDISKAKKMLSWKPPYSVDEGLEKTASWFLEQYG